MFLDFHYNLSLTAGQSKKMCFSIFALQAPCLDILCGPSYRFDHFLPADCLFLVIVGYIYPIYYISHIYPIFLLFYVIIIFVGVLGFGTFGLEGLLLVLFLLCWLLNLPWLICCHWYSLDIQPHLDGKRCGLPGNRGRKYSCETVLSALHHRMM